MKNERARQNEHPLSNQLRMPDFSHSLPMLLLRGREAVMRYFRPSLLAHGVTEQQWRVLRALNSVDEMEVLMLANATYLFASSMSRILRDLQRRGLIIRRNDRHDLRRSHVAISAKGKELIATLLPTSEAIYNDIYQRFGPKNFKSLQELLLGLESKLNAHASDISDSGPQGHRDSARAARSKRRPSKGKR
jgi:homoprotocatechuate degradation regulator HpaR